MTAAASMTPAKPRPKPKCGAKTRSGGKCGRPRGWGTTHPGHGRCKLHGGASPSGEKNGHELAARAFAVGALGAEVDIEPLGAMLQAVRLAAGMTAHYRLAIANAADGAVLTGLELSLAQAVDRQSRISKAALDAGVDERRVRLAERMADTISAAAEEALAILDVSPADRTRFAAVFAAALARHEGESMPVLELEAKAVA